MTFRQHNPPHPGELIWHTYIEPFDGISARNIANRLKVSPSTFNRLLNGHAGISPTMAVRLSEVLGGSAESWLTLQESFDLWEARKTVDVSELKAIDFNSVA
ncbi:MAG: HigA family addiction module antidote protein [Gammaproteobacteria bacterium]|nr:HigA family addiction module antidote protein [Gammaproteobacteria bacterium]